MKDSIGNIGYGIGQAVATEFAKAAGRTITKTLETALNPQDPGSAATRHYAKTAYGGRKRFNLQKLLRSSVNHTEQVLGVKQRTTNLWSRKHPVSEYGINGGYMGICFDSANITTATEANISGCTPMHIYDLNLFIGGTSDEAANYPIIGNSQTSDFNARSWFWSTSNKWHALRESNYLDATTQTFAPMEHRWFINDPRTTVQAANPSTKVFRKSIAIDYMFYATTALETEYDIRVIRITDPKMCPDYDIDLNKATGEDFDLKEFQQNWQNMVRAQTINPMLRGVEPGPKPVQPWFKTIAKKRVKIGEQTTDVSRLPCVQGKIYVKLNEMNNYAWSMKDFDVETNDTIYDGGGTDGDNGQGFGVDDSGSNNNFMHKPYYTSRYYLLIRAISSVDNATTGNLDEATAGGWQRFFPNGISAYTYQPSYDLAVRTHWLTINAN